MGRTLTLWAYTDRIEVTDGERLVATHSRVYSRGETRFELPHYLPALARKPRAATHLAVVPKLPPVYAQVQRVPCSRRPDGYREFARILLLHREFPAEVITEALEQAASQGLLEPQAVRQLILNRLARPAPEPVPVPDRFAALRVRASDPACYDALLGGNRR